MLFSSEKVGITNEWNVGGNIVLLAGLNDGSDLLLIWWKDRMNRERGRQLLWVSQLVSPISYAAHTHTHSQSVRRRHAAKSTGGTYQ